MAANRNSNNSNTAAASSEAYRTGTVVPDETNEGNVVLTDSESNVSWSFQCKSLRMKLDEAADKLKAGKKYQIQYNPTADSKKPQESNGRVSHFSIPRFFKTGGYFIAARISPAMLEAIAAQQVYVSQRGGNGTQLEDSAWV